jgi:predicted regulator of Ras-like GTPase activity (Roadblock/LC7/MglB family)
VHWLSERLSSLLDLAPPSGGDPQLRKAFLDAVTTLVEEVARRPGVDVAFASCEGLPVAASGASREQAERLAAMAQAAFEPVSATVGGDVRQVVVVGETHKLALVRVGPVLFGLRSPADVSLAAATATGP